MNRHEEARLQTLQQDASKPIDSRWPYGGPSEKITTADLLLLLREDPKVRALITEILQSASKTNRAHPTADEANVETTPYPISIPPSPTRAAALPDNNTRNAALSHWAPEWALLDAVRADSELCNDWLGTANGTPERQLIRVVVCAAQWDLLCDLWDKLASRCKQQQRGVHKEELHILRSALALYNLRWQGMKAKLVEEETGIAYDYEYHQRGSSTGTTIKAIWLPGLLNPGQELCKKPLVQT